MWIGNSGENLTMGNLKEMIEEDTSLGERVREGARKVRLARIGLLNKVNEERVRLYKEIVEAGAGDVDEKNALVRFNTLRAGVVSLIREEGQRIFDELVDAGTRIQIEITERPEAVAEPEAAVEAKITKPVKVAKGGKKSEQPAPAQEKTLVKPKNGNDESVLEDLEEQFVNAQARVRDLGEKIDRKAMGVLYALFKQGVEGDVKGRRPAAAKVDECARFDVRREIKGMSTQEAMEKYIQKVNELPVK